MSGSQVIEVGIGLALFYLLFSLICSVLNEIIATYILRLRANFLYDAITKLLGDKEWAKTFYDHPLVKGITRRNGKPSYISSRTFARVLLDLVGGQGTQKTVGEVRAAIEKNEKSAPAELKKALLALIDAGEKAADEARKNVEDWFDDAMARVSGWYKRRIQLIMLVIALAIASLLNADTLTMANTLWRDEALRASVVAIAEETAKQPLPPESEPSLTRVAQLQDELDQLKLPLGWVTAPDQLGKPEKPADPRQVPRDFWGWFYKVLGLLLTTFALSLGAEFWFDTLKRFVALRYAGKNPAEEKK